MFVLRFKSIRTAFGKIIYYSSRCDTGLVHDLQLTWASGESETKGKGEKVCGSNLMI